MITLRNIGQYELAIIAEGSQILFIDSTPYKHFPGTMLEFIDETNDAWNDHTAIHLSAGEYRLYDIHDELQLSETLHLELAENEGSYVKHYLLPNGFPSRNRKRVRQIITRQHITNTSKTIIKVRLLESGTV